MIEGALLFISLFVLVCVLAVTVYQARSIAEQKQRIQEQLALLEESNQLLRQAADIGVQTAEICHNINHFLQTRSLYTQLIEEKGWSPAYAESLQFSNENIGRLVTEIQNLLAGSDTTDTLQHDLRQTIEASFTTASEFTDRRDIRLDNRIPKDRRISFDSTLPELCNNIFINAIQATAEGAGSSIRVEAAGGGLQISDQGSGIPEPDRDRLFSTYYSTQGKSIGLGMGYIRRCCRRNRYRLELDSGPEGTCVRILPERADSGAPPDTQP